MLILLLIIAILAITKWIGYFYGLAGMIHYMEENNIKLPTDEEAKKAIKWAVKSSISSLKVKYKFFKLKCITKIRR